MQAPRFLDQRRRIERRNALTDQSFDVAQVLSLLRVTK
jgi:hypothetical protein